MKNFAFLIILVLLSCQSSKQIFDTKNAFVKINIEFKSAQNKFNLNGYSYFHPDSNILNIYGPLGINVAKIVSRYDSITIIDIQNKRIYRTKYFKSSEIIFNFFNGKFSGNEQHLVCSLCSLFVSGLNCAGSYEKPLFYFKSYILRRSKYIKGSLNSPDGFYSVKIKMSGNNINSSISSSLVKYVNFENIYLDLK